MVDGDNMMGDSLSLSGFGSTDIGQSGLVLSDEDVAWADSLYDDWNPSSDTFLQIINSENNSSGDGKKRIPAGVKNQNIWKLSESNGAEPNNDENSNHENSDDFLSRFKNIEDIFLPTYNENLKDLGCFDDAGLDWDFQEFESEQSTEGIFKVWDLEIPAEEDDGDIVKQFNKALPDYSSEPTNIVSDDSKAWQDLKDLSIDDLISGISDLSLSTIAG